MKFLYIALLLLFGLLPETTRAAVSETSEPTLNDSSFYEIGSAEQLKWFADKVKSGSQSINGVLIADINLNTLGEEYWTPIGLLSEEGFIYKSYKGKFNGQNHVVTGLVLRKAMASGLFGYTEGAVINNITVSGAQMKTTRDTRVSSIQYGIGVICGLAIGGTQIDNCHATMTELNYYIDDANMQKDIDCVGGIAGELRSSTITNCTADGFICTDGKYVGGIVGALNTGFIKNCQFNAFNGGNSKVIGLDYVGGIVGFLQGRTANYAIVGCTVSNGSVITAKAGASGTIVASDTLLAEPGEWEGYREIYTPEQLKTFASLVNGGQTSLKGKLMNDLNMSKAGGFSPIGTSDNPFAGEFDGQNYTIDSLTINNQKYGGLFGYVKDGAIKNLKLTNPYLATQNNNYLGLLVGFLTQNSGHPTPVGYIENCQVTNGQLVRNGKGEPQYVGGLVGKMDMSAEMRDCSFQGMVKAHEDYIGGIVGCMDSGAKLYRCYTMGPSIVWGDDYVGGVVGYMTDTQTLIDNCNADQSTGTITIHAEDSGYSGLIRGYDKSGSVTKTKYNEGGLQYELTGKKVSVNGKQVTETHITGVSDKSKSSHYACVDIGSSGSDYFNTVIENLDGAEELYFWDNISNLAQTKACGWINMTINDYAFGSSFKRLKMMYRIFAGDDHDVMLRPCDVRPAGEKMFANCPNAKIFVDAEYYDEFCNDSIWGKYKSHIVPVTSMRTEDVNAEHGARYAYDRNRDNTGSAKKENDVHQVHVIGADDSYINDSDNDNTLWIYQDIGETYDYNTTKIWASAFKGKNNIKKMKMQAITKSGRRPSQAFHIEIGDSVFANCKNLSSVEIALYSDQGADHTEVLHPYQIPVGKGVFAGCSSVKIYVDPTVLNEFRNDTQYGWAQYRDIISASNSAWSIYEEDGVKYGHVTSPDGKTRYTSKNKAEMEEYVKTWVGQFANFTTKSVLCPDYDGTMNYMVATGVNPDDDDIEDGNLKIYNDIGNTYDYKTIALSATGFRGNTQIKSITFEDCAGSSGNANVELSLVIPDGTFEGCSNLRELNMFQYVTKGTNHYESIKPTQVFIGKDVFKGVHHDFRIKVIPALYDDYIKDPNWSQYKDLITASDYVPTGQSDITKEGVTYGYASSTLNTTTTKETVQLQASIWNVPIIIAETVMLAQDIYSFLDLLGYKSEGKVIKQVFLEAEEDMRYYEDEVIRLWKNAKNVPGTNLYNPKAEFSHFVNRHNIDYIEYIEDGVEKMTVFDANFYTKYDFAEDALKQVTKNTIQATSAFYSSAILTAGAAVGPTILDKMAGSRPLNNAISYLTNRASKNFTKKTSWYINAANWVTERVRNNVPQMYVKDVKDQSTINIYVNPGTSNSWDAIKYAAFQTMEIGRTAFHDKNNIKEVKFTDCEGNNVPIDPMVMVLPDSCFYTCNGLEKLNLVLHSDGPRIGSYMNRYKALTPDNFILAGDIFAGCDTTKIRIYVGAKVLQDFLDDDYWGKYKTMYRTVDVKEVEDNNEWSCRYTYTYDNNTMPLVTTTSSDETIYHVDIFGPDDDALINKNNGLAALINDYGLTYNYQLDNVKANAFKGDPYLKILDVTDSHSNTGDVYTTFQVNLEDSAFAHCPNFEEFNLIYQVTDGTNSTTSLAPSQLTIGKGVFADCPKLNIKICLDQEEAFFSDMTWAIYSSKIKPCFFAPRDKKVFNLLKSDYKFKTDLNGNESWDHIDAMRAKPEELKDIFKGSDIKSFDEFRAFGTCGLKNVYDGMFSNCSSLQSIELPDSIVTIGKEAFKNCTNLLKLEIPDSVKTIAENAFTGSAIKEFVVKSPVPANIDAAKAFSGLMNEKDYLIYVPDTAVATYKKQWADVKDHINALSKRVTLRVIKLPKAGVLQDSLGINVDISFFDNSTGNFAQYDSLRIIGPLDGKDIRAIRYLGGRNTENVKNGVGHLRYLDLYDAELKKSSDVYNYQPVDNNWDEIISNCKIEGDGYVDRYMFSGMTDLEMIILPKTTKKIRSSAFNSCPKLHTVVVGDETKEIESFAGANCPNMQYLIMLPEKVPETERNSWPFHGMVTVNKTNMSGGLKLNGEYTRIQVIAPPTTYGDYFKSDAYTTYTADSIGCLFSDEAIFKAMKQAHVFSPSQLVNLKDISGLVCGNTDVSMFNELFVTSVDTLGKNSLNNMTNMTAVTLPYGLKHITADAFVGCSSLTDVLAINDSIPTIDPKVFNDLPSNFVISVMTGREESYRKAWPEWESHIKSYRPEKNIREITLTTMNTLADSLNLKLWMTGHTVTGITGNMSDITALKVNGPIGNKDLAVMRMLAGREPYNGALSYATNLKYLNLYDANIRKDEFKFGFVGDFAQCIDADNEIPIFCFKECYNPETLILPKTATVLNDEALYDMYSLSTLTIGDKLTKIGNDALGECNSLKKIIFLCDKKPELDDDAFTDPIMWYNDVYKVDKMYVRKDIIDDYTKDKEYTSHASNITSVFPNDDLFRAYGSRGIATEDDLASISAITGWFTWYDGIDDLSSLNKSNITTFSSDDVSNLKSLQHVSLPSTVKTISDGTFANNEQLSWVDLTRCDSLTNDIGNLGIHDEALIYAPSTAKHSVAPSPVKVKGMRRTPSVSARNAVNTVYNVDGQLVCEEYHMPTTRSYDVPTAFTAKKLVLDRNFTPQTYTTITLPFVLTRNPSGFKFFKLYDKSEEEIGLKRAYSTEEYVPYVVWAEKKRMTINTETMVSSTGVGKVVKNQGYTMRGAIESLSNDEAQDLNVLKFDSQTNLWNIVQADAADSIQKFSAYIQVNDLIASSKDVPNKFLDPQYFYTIGTAQYMLDGDDVEVPLTTDSLKLVDGLDFKADKTFATAAATYSRTMNATWGTLCLPYAFDASSTSDFQIYEVTNMTETDLVIKQLTGTVEAGRPVLVRCPKKGNTVVIEVADSTEVLNKEVPDVNGQLVGSFVQTDVPSGTYFISNDQFWRTDDYSQYGVKISGFRGYLKNSAQVKTSSLRITIDEGETTAADKLNAIENEANAIFYDLNGRRTNGLQKGLNIVKRGNKVTKVIIH